ncbi:MAG: TonB-dependent receptor domain-containing protein [Bacteroidia bacterium]
MSLGSPKYLFIIALFACFLFPAATKAQYSLNILVKDAKTGDALAGAAVQIPSLHQGAVSDKNGSVSLNLPDSICTLLITYTGYKNLSRVVKLVASTPILITVTMEKKEEELETVIISSVRTNNRIEDIPVRVEVLGSEEVNEELVMKPSNITKLLGETSGILTQQTSPVSGTTSFRLLGLPGTYTQLLKDGLPLYSGFSSGLSLLQIPPLDLKQVEIIKGSSNALYGGNAVAGIVNLLSKTPGDSNEFTILLNQTHLLGSDVSAFFSGKGKHMGTTILASASNQQAIGDPFTVIPLAHQLHINPKLFCYFNPATTLIASVSASYDERTGGDRIAVTQNPDSAHPYFEKHISTRLSSSLVFEHTTEKGNRLDIKTSMTHFDRSIASPGYAFSGTQTASYSEVSYLSNLKKHKLVSGATLISDQFTDQNHPALYAFDYTYLCGGLFVQDDWTLGKKLILQSGIRADEHSVYGSFVLPKLSFVYKVNPSLYIRAGAGTGYKAPTVFTDLAESMLYRRVYALPAGLDAERSGGYNADINYKHILGDEASITVNQAFYYTLIQRALIPRADSLSKGILVYTNAPAGIESRCSETNLRLKANELEFYCGYTYTEALKKYDQDNQVEFTPRHRLVLTLVYGKEHSWRVGLEEFYTGTQYLGDRSLGHDFWISGAIAEKTFKHVTLVVNAENIFNVRQSQFGAVVLGPVTNPVFRDVYAPLEGFVGNIAVKIRL